MQLTTVALALLSAASAAFAAPSDVTVKVTGDQTYDSPTFSLYNVACGTDLLARGYTTLGSLPNFPFAGGSMFVPGACGSCWTLSAPGGSPVNVLAVDTAGVGFNIGKQALQQLGGDAAIAAGSVDATAVQADPSVCGF